MSKRKHQSQQIAAAQAGISVRSARRIERDARLPSQKPRRHWRSRPDPFAAVWESEVVPMLAAAPRLQAITILRTLQEQHPEQYPDSTRRTLERRLRQWRAQCGPEQEVFFPQQHAPGMQGLSDFTDMAELGVTIAGQPFAHRLYHFVLAFSRWEYASIVEGGESFEALSAGLQNALWQAGGCPREHRTDSLSAAFKNLHEEADFTARYAALLAHYGMSGTRNNRGLGHENGSVESAHRHLKAAIDQALLLRGQRDFADRAAYAAFLGEVIVRRNRRHADAFRLERAQLLALPARRTSEFVEEQARVSRCSTFTVRGILYSAPSRLIGHRLTVRVYADRLDCFVSGALVHRAPRSSRTANNRHALDYRHFIEALKRKPQAFKGLAFRDALFPREAYRRTWEQLEARLSSREACKRMVGLLELAAREGVEAVLATRLNALLVDGRLPELEALREEFAPRQAQCPVVQVEIPPASGYDELLDQGAA